jgi:hypothetical protein
VKDQPGGGGSERSLGGGGGERPPGGGPIGSERPLGGGGGERPPGGDGSERRPVLHALTFMYAHLLGRRHYHMRMHFSCFLFNDL